MKRSWHFQAHSSIDDRKQLTTAGRGCDGHCNRHAGRGASSGKAHSGDNCLGRGQTVVDQDDWTPCDAYLGVIAAVRALATADLATFLLHDTLQDLLGSGRLWSDNGFAQDD